MSESFKPVPPVPLMSAVRARDIGRQLYATGSYLREQGVIGEARLLETRAQWWLSYALALSQIPPGQVDDTDL